jgi:hypothetical protein
MDACQRIVTRAAMRILIGLPYCRNEELLELSRLYANSVFAGTAIINCLPPLLRPVIGPLIGIRAKFYQQRCKRILLPLVEERIRLWNKDKQGQNLPACNCCKPLWIYVLYLLKSPYCSIFTYTKFSQNDFLQWLLPTCANAGPDQIDQKRLQ